MNNDDVSTLRIQKGRARNIVQWGSACLARSWLTQIHSLTSHMVPQFCLKWSVSNEQGVSPEHQSKFWAYNENKQLEFRKRTLECKGLIPQILLRVTFKHIAQNRLWRQLGVTKTKVRDSPEGVKEGRKGFMEGLGLSHFICTGSIGTRKIEESSSGKSLYMGENTTWDLSSTCRCQALW